MQVQQANHAYVFLIFDIMAIFSPAKFGSKVEHKYTSGYILHIEGIHNSRITNVLRWIEKNIKVFTSLPIKAYYGISVIAPLTLNSGARRWWVVNRTLRPPYSYKLGGSQSSSGLYVEEQNLFPLPGFDSRVVWLEVILRNLTFVESVLK
jgi:hypothetical protein